MDKISNREQVFIDAICAYKPPVITDLTVIAKDDPNKAELLNSFHKGASETKNIISTLSGAVNSLVFEPHKIIENIKKDNNGYDNLLQLAYEWVDVWHKAPDYFTDPRNEVSTKLCKQIADALITHDGFITDRKCFVELDKAVLSMHRTLVQSATNMFITVLRDENRSVQHLINKEYGEKDLHLPMI